MGRIQGLTDTPVLTGSQLLKTGNGYVFSITLSWRGATAGDEINLRDGLDESGKSFVKFIVAAATGTITKEWPNGKEFSTGLFYDEGGLASTFAELTYR
jgi:hypothetical protein